MLNSRLITMISLAFLTATQLGMAGERVAATIGSSEEILGTIEILPAKDGSRSPRLISPPAYFDGYCRRTVLPLAVLNKQNSRMEIGEALTRHATWHEYAFANDASQCGSSLSYFRPGMTNEAEELAVAFFLSSLRAWRDPAVVAPARFKVEGMSASAQTCLKSEPGLQIDAMGQYSANDGDEGDTWTFRAAFNRCADQKSGRPLAAIIKYARATRSATVNLTFSETTVD